MGIFDKAKDLAAQHSDKIRQGVEKAGDMVDERTGGKHAHHVDRAQDAINKALDDQQPDRATPDPQNPAPRNPAPQNPDRPTPQPPAGPAH